LLEALWLLSATHLQHSPSALASLVPASSSSLVAGDKIYFVFLELATNPIPFPASDAGRQGGFCPNDDAGIWGSSKWQKLLEYEFITFFKGV